jgi:hypothetical protein
MRKTNMATRLSKSKKVHDLLAHFLVHDQLALNTYQLLAACAGLLLETRKRKATAILIVHQFMSDVMNLEKLARNADGLRMLHRALFLADPPADRTFLSGPIPINGRDFFLGKVETHL